MPEETVALYVLHEDPNVPPEIGRALRALPRTAFEAVRVLSFHVLARPLKEAAANPCAAVLADPAMLDAADPALVKALRVARRPLILLAKPEGAAEAASRVLDGEADDYLVVGPGCDAFRLQVVLERLLRLEGGREGDERGANREEPAAGAPGPDEGAPGAEEGGPVEPQKRVQVLVIDDDVHLLNFVRKALQAEGYTVRQAATGGQGLIQALRHRPDIILLDLMLPDMAGSEVLRLLRSKETTRTTPILILSACRTKKAVMETSEKGADGYLVKPVRLNTLRERVARTLEDAGLTPPASGDVAAR